MRVGVFLDEANGLIGSAVTKQLGERAEVIWGAEGPIDAAYIGCSPQAAAAAVSAAVEAGAGRLVLLSSASAPFERGVPEDQQWFLPAERAVARAGVEWTAVRPVGLMAAALAWADEVQAESVIRHPHTTAAYPHVHEVDVAAVVAAALLDDGHDGVKLSVSGPASITVHEQAEALSEALTRTIRVEELTPEDAAARWRAAGWDDGDIELELELLDDFVQRPPRPSKTVERVLDRAATPFRQWANDHAPLFR